MSTAFSWSGATARAVTLNPDGTFTYIQVDALTTFTYCANGTVTGTTCSSGITATVTLGAAPIEAASWHHLHQS